MRVLIYINIVILSLFTASCEEDHIIPEGEILTDTSSFKTYIYLVKSINNSGIEESKTSVVFYTNDKFTIVKEGVIKLNDQNMDITRTRRDLINGTLIYEYTSKTKIESDKLYTIYIQISDGSVYNCTINSQKSDFYKLDIPEIHNRKNDMQISWTTPQNFDETYLYIKNYSNHELISSSGSFLSASQQGINDYTIQNKFLLNHHKQNSDVDRVAIELSFYKEGIMDKKLDGIITSRFEIEKECLISD